MAIEDTYLSTFDVDLGLIETRDDSEESWTRRALAGASVGMPLDDPYHAANELLCAVQWICAGDASGKHKLAEILGNAHCDDYQRNLYYALAGRGALAMCGDLDWLVKMLAARRDVGRAALARDLGIKVARHPYVIGTTDGPTGRFDGAYTLSNAWQDIALSL